MSDWNTQRIEQLAPDGKAVKEAQGVAKPAKWRALGRDERLIWGECLGSGSTPYLVRIDLTDASNKCSCPSRKLPCKHALALLMLLATGSAIPSTAPPAFVAEWQAERLKRAAARAAKQAAAAETAPDDEARAKRIARRESRVEEGLELLDSWLCDLIGQGLAAARTQPPGVWTQMAARLVDAQAPGLGQRVRNLGEVALSSPDWQSELLVRLARLQLLADAYRRIDRLPQPLADEVRTLIGWTQPQEALLVREGLRTRWQVVGRHQEQVESNLRIHKTWLLSGEHSAVLIEFSAPNQPPATSYAVGRCLDAEVVYFDGVPPLRALIKTVHASLKHPGTLPSPQGLGEIQSRFCELLAMNPWLEKWPLVLGPVFPQFEGSTCQLMDIEGRAVLLSRRFKHGWQLVALAQGEPCVVFGEWDGHTFEPRTVEHRQQLYTLELLGAAPVLAKVA
jgi:hypothetical protein